MTRLLALVGPTASGKTRIACDLAPELGAEILCVDSMTVYRGMDVGTAKPTAEERARVPHHLLDIADPAEPFSVARLQRHAEGALEDVRARGRVPLLVGGSGLSFRAVVDRLVFPPTDPSVRARLESQDREVLAVRLKELDPDAADFVNLQNKRRVVRALEVIELTGKPFSSFRDAWDRYLPVAVAGLRVTPEELDRRIRARLREMLAAGFLEEVRALLARGLRNALTASRAIAYRQGVALLDGTITEDEFFEQSARATRSFARRQMAWFRRDPRVHWFDADDLGRAATEVGAYYRQQPGEG